MSGLVCGCSACQHAKQISESTKVTTGKVQALLTNSKNHELLNLVKGKFPPSRKILLTVVTLLQEGLLWTVEILPVRTLQKNEDLLSNYTGFYFSCGFPETIPLRSSIQPVFLFFLFEDRARYFGKFFDSYFGFNGFLYSAGWVISGGWGEASSYWKGIYRFCS